MTTSGFICSAEPLLPAVAGPMAKAIDHRDHGRDILPRARDMASPPGLEPRTISPLDDRENREICPFAALAGHWTA
jgi:hypothetical protein